METTITVNGWLRKVFYVAIALQAAALVFIAYRQQNLTNQWQRWLQVGLDGEFTPQEMQYVVGGHGESK